MGYFDSTYGLSGIGITTRLSVHTSNNSNPYDDSDVAFVIDATAAAATTTTTAAAASTDGICHHHHGDQPSVTKQDIPP